MARLLGGTSHLRAGRSRDQQHGLFNENPDQPAVLQRRFNYFDYLANGQLKGGITLDRLKMLANTLLPLPDQYVIVDRQRASANGFLVDPTALRNITVPAAPAAELHVGAQVGQGLLEVAGAVPQRLAGAVRHRPERDAGHHVPALHAVLAWPGTNTTSGGSITKTTSVGGQTIGIALTQPVVTYTPPASSSATTTTQGFYVGGDKLDHGFDRDRDHGHRPGRPRARQGAGSTTGAAATTTATGSTTGATTTAGTGRPRFDHGNRHGFVSFRYPVHRS